MTPRATFRIGLVVSDIVVTSHTARAIRAHLGFVNVVACRAFGVALSDGHISEAVEPWQLGDFVTSRAGSSGRHRATMRLVTGHALTMSFWALRQLLIVTAPARDHAHRLMRRALVTSLTAGVPEVAARQANLSNVTSSTQGAIAEPAQVEPVWLVAPRTDRLARMKRALRPGLFVAL